MARGKTLAGRMFTAPRRRGTRPRTRRRSRPASCARGRPDEHPVLAAVEPLVAEVAHVGDVLDVEDLDAVVEQHAPDQVREQVAAQVADVGVAVDGRAAGVHPDATRLDRLDRADGSGEGVAEAQGHMGQARRVGSDGHPTAAAGHASEGHPARLARILPPMRRPSPALSPSVSPCSSRRSLAWPVGRGVRSDRPVRILVGEPATLDPAAQGDASSAAVIGAALRDADHLRRATSSSSRPSPTSGGSRTAGRGWCSTSART